MTEESLLKRFPALQAQVGDWQYYITTLSFEEIARRVLPALLLVTPADMSSWIQRRVLPRRANQIAKYLMDQRQHFFPGLVVGVYLGEPTWFEIDIADSPFFGTPYLDAMSNGTLGILQLDGTEKLYAIDGQHRVAGIKKALDLLRKKKQTEAYRALANETLSIAFVSADIDKKGELERVRRLFTTLNKEAKKVSEPEIVALDEDDPAAIVTRWLAVRYDGLRAKHPSEKESDHSLIQLGTQHEIRASNRRSITTIVTLYRMIKSVFQFELKAIATRSKGNRPDDETLETLYLKAEGIWNLLRHYDSGLGDVLGSDPIEERASNYRTEDGGHMLFRPIGLQAFSRALGLLRGRSIDDERAVESLCRLPMEISQPPWEWVVWNPNTRGMVTANKPMAEALFLYMLNQSPRTDSYKLGIKYGELLGNPNNNPLEQVPVYGLR